MKKILPILLLVFGLFSCQEVNTLTPTDTKTETVVEQTYSISFVSEFGQIPSKLEDLKEFPLELPTLEYEGYQFLGWFLDGESVNDLLGQPLENDVVLTAKWEEILYDFNDSSNKNLLASGGYVDGYITDFSEYENTQYYRKVSNALELSLALYDAKYKYSNTWDSENNCVIQTLEEESKVRVIEITNDINLGYNVIPDEAKSNGIIADYKSSNACTSMIKENGISQIKVENISNLLIYSKNGAKLTHAGFKVTSCHNLVFRNIIMDEIWEWEDSNDSSINKIGDYDKFGWAYFKISHCGHIWIDHMTFGKSYDGQIDVSNPVSNSVSTKMRLAYGSDGTMGVHVSFCSFLAGSDDKDGYLYKMMKEIEDEYNSGLKNYLYYNSLRDAGLSFEDILYGIAIPQKKGFLCGDNASSKDDFYYNDKLFISFNSCKFINFQDRLPKVRGGKCVIYNCLIDSTEYYGYRNLVKSIGSVAVKQVNSSWKCPAVSQGILVSYGGYVHVENTIIKGIEEIIKNNDSGTNPFVSNVGYYNFINCSYQLSADKKIFVGSTTDQNVLAIFYRNTNILKIADGVFSYNNGEKPFNYDVINLDDLPGFLDDSIYGCGVKMKVISWLDCNLKGE